jgi:Beta protein
MRGEKLDNPTGSGHEQYIAQAQLLCGRPEYRGRSFSAGDEYIYVIATEMKQTGNPKTWIQAAMNHHMTLAARQISAALAA